MIITIPFKTPTINHLNCYTRWGGYMKKEYKLLRKEIIKICDETISPETKEYFKNKKLKVMIAICEDWYYLNGNVKKVDVANREKFLTDSVFQGLGLDDKNIFYISLRKVQLKRFSGKVEPAQEKTIFSIEVLNGNPA